MKSAVINSMTAIAGVALLSGCTLATRDHRGYVMDETLTSAVQPGVDNKASVEKTLGQPTFTGQFSPNDWYYLSRETRAFAFRNPKVTDQSVLHVRFDHAFVGGERTGLLRQSLSANHQSLVGGGEIQYDPASWHGLRTTRHVPYGSQR